ncbi:MAG: hypothetical protein EBZ74_06305, partial [Planctomycetia bacterium]|nr:hypothetical protein [Planctomycetia bacterium]
SCRRPSFMEFRSPCSSRAPAYAAPPCGAPACAPACDPCQSAAPCCDEGPAVPAPAAAPVVREQGTFS